MADETLHLLVKGKVQGVGFRWFVVEEARRRGVAGWVRNNSDGAVEICARGPAEILSALEAHIRKGPTGANVSSVERIETASERELTAPFSIARN